jgi:membrane-associated phospholipid phosphatase
MRLVFRSLDLRGPETCGDFVRRRCDPPIDLRRSLELYFRPKRFGLTREKRSERRLMPTTWANRNLWIAYIKFLALFYLFFFPVFWGAAYLQRASGRPLDLYWAWETHLPFVPFMIFPYLSLFALFLLPLVHLRPEEIRVLSRQSTLTLAIAFVAFIAVPARLGFAARPDAGKLQPLYDFLDALDLTRPFTAAPSLHVAFAALILLACAAKAPRPLAIFYRMWLALLSASTILTHQHHIVDVAAGLGVAFSVRAIISDRVMLISAPSASEEPIRQPSL